MGRLWAFGRVIAEWITLTHWVVRVSQPYMFSTLTGVSWITVFDCINTTKVHLFTNVTRILCIKHFPGTKSKKGRMPRLWRWSLVGVTPSYFTNILFANPKSVERSPRTYLKLDVDFALSSAVEKGESFWNKRYKLSAQRHLWKMEVLFVGCFYVANKYRFRCKTHPSGF